jgi:small basic protein
MLPLPKEVQKLVRDENLIGIYGVPILSRFVSSFILSILIIVLLASLNDPDIGDYLPFYAIITGIYLFRYIPVNRRLLFLTEKRIIP